LCLLRLTEIFDRSQGSNGRIVERQQIDNIQEELPIPVCLFFLQRPQLLLKQPNTLGPDQLLGPDLERFRGLGRPVRVLAPLRSFSSLFFLPIHGAVRQILQA
jgi:hypothetical protein